MRSSKSALYRLSVFASILAFCVILLGAYVRLSDAGLGCPDWPGCYGKILVPSAEHAGIHSPELNFEAHKAWKEMVHRYLASTLGLTVMVLMVWSWLRLKSMKQAVFPTFIGLWVIFQGMLGMWTVTIKLHPFVVMSHLLGGFLTFVLLVRLAIREKMSVAESEKYRLFSEKKYAALFRIWLPIGIFLLVVQIALGGWTSANYASLACPDFPTCQGKVWPSLHFFEAFNVWRDFGHNYEGGVLNNEGRTIIHMMHRTWAVVVFLFLFGVLTKIVRRTGGISKKIAVLGICFLILQVSLGISNVILSLPLPIAVAHNGVAVLLLSTLVGLRSLFIVRNDI